MKILTVIGARPQFIKASVVSKAIAKHVGIGTCGLFRNDLVIEAL